jgi:hypothetical protein
MTVNGEVMKPPSVYAMMESLETDFGYTPATIAIEIGLPVSQVYHHKAAPRNRLNNSQGLRRLFFRLIEFEGEAMESLRDLFEALDNANKSHLLLSLTVGTEPMLRSRLRGLLTQIRKARSEHAHIVKCLVEIVKIAYLLGDYAHRQGYFASSPIRSDAPTRRSYRRAARWFRLANLALSRLPDRGGLKVAKRTFAPAIQQNIFTSNWMALPEDKRATDETIRHDVVAYFKDARFLIGYAGPKAKLEASLSAASYASRLGMENECLEFLRVAYQVDQRLPSYVNKRPPGFRKSLSADSDHVLSVKLIESGKLHDHCQNLVVTRSA